MKEGINEQTVSLSVCFTRAPCTTSARFVRLLYLGLCELLHVKDESFSSLSVCLSVSFHWLSIQAISPPAVLQDIKGFIGRGTSSKEATKGSNQELPQVPMGALCPAGPRPLQWDGSSSSRNSDCHRRGLGLSAEALVVVLTQAQILRFSKRRPTFSLKEELNHHGNLSVGTPLNPTHTDTVSSAQRPYFGQPRIMA